MAVYFYKCGSLSTDDPTNLVFLSGLAGNNTNYYSSFWKCGVSRTAGNAYQVPAGKKLRVTGVQSQTWAGTSHNSSWAIGYATGGGVSENSSVAPSGTTVAFLGEPANEAYTGAIGHGGLHSSDYQVDAQQNLVMQQMGVIGEMPQNVFPYMRAGYPGYPCLIYLYGILVDM